MTPRIEWAVFCNAIARGPNTELSLINLVNAMLAQGGPLPGRLLFVFSVHADVGAALLIRLFVRLPDGSAWAWEPIRLVADRAGFAHGELQLNKNRPILTDVPGDVCVECRFDDDEAVAHVATLRFLPVAPTSPRVQ